jgi:serine/threonine-protein kinase RsbW
VSETLPPLKGNHSHSSGSAAWVKNLRTPGSPDALPRIRQEVVDAAEECGFDGEDIIKIEMAVGEACTNVIEHAYTTQSLKLDIEVQIARFNDRMEVAILDYSSINFAVNEASTVVDLDDWMTTGKRRGLGIFIIQSFVDKVEHRFVCGQGNELKLTKFFA